MGGAVGGTVALLLIVIAMFLFRRYRLRRRANIALFDTSGTLTEPSPFAMERTAFLPAVPSSSGKGEPIASPGYTAAFLHAGNPSSATSSSQASGTPVASNPETLDGLRTEMQELRRAMLDLHADRIEAPPSYE